MATAYKLCRGEGGCGRMIVEELFEHANQHAPGCHIRRSAMAKEAAAAKKSRRERAQRAAVTRRTRALAQAVA